MPTILVVEDEEDMLETIAYNLERVGHTVMRAQRGLDALSLLDEQTPDLVISDIMMPGMDGLAFCAEVRLRPDTRLLPFLFVTAKGHAEDKYAGLRAGADDYITKPFDLQDLLARVDGRLAHRRRTQEMEEAVEQNRKRWEQSFDPAELREVRAQERDLTEQVSAAGHPGFDPGEPPARAMQRKMERYAATYPRIGHLRKTTLVGDHPAHLRIFEEILIAASSPDPTLIIGESGTGKTATAEAIWALGERADKPFITVNCSELAAGDPTIATGKLFGYGKNTGLPNMPRGGQPGLLEEAHGGVLFLDEVATLPAQAQALLLLPLERRPFHPAVGIGSEKLVDVKFVLATNRDLEEEVAQGRFPRDVFERMAGEVVRVAPLRERPSDIPQLAEHFLRALGEENGSGPSSPEQALGSDCLAALRSYHWPGNVRELRRVVRNACRRASLSGRDAILTADLPDEVHRPKPLAQQGSDSPSPGVAQALPGFAQRERAEINALRATGFRVSEAEALLGYSSKSRTLSHRLRGLCLKALSLSEWDADAAALLLAGDNDAQVAAQTRRMRALLDGMAARLDEPEQKVLKHLLAEHRMYAVEARHVLRSRSG